MKNRFIYLISLAYSSLFIVLFFTVNSKKFLSINTHTIPTLPAAALVAFITIIIFMLGLKQFSGFPLRHKAFGISLIFTILLSPFGDYCLPFLVLSIILLLDKAVIKKLLFSYDFLDFSWLLFVVWCFFISASAEMDKSASFGMSAAFLGYSILFKIFRHREITQKFLDMGLILFGVSLSVVVGFGLYHLNLNKNINLFGIILQPHGNPGLASFMSNWPANTAGFLVMSLSIMVYQCFLAFTQHRSLSSKIFFVVTTTIIFIGLLATETRMALLFIIGFLGSFVVFYPFKTFRKQRFLLLLIPILLMPLLSLKSKKWHETLFEPLKQSTIQDRIHQNKYGFHLWQKYPITGVGILNFRYFYDQYGTPIIKKLKIGHSRIEFLHNIYTSMLVETGIIGLILFLIPILSLGLYFKKYNLYFGLYFLSGMLVAGLVDGWLFILRFSLMMFIILGYSCHIKFKSPKA
ncbi:MAG: O-antigen ligase family protein [Brevinema sp.]